MSGPYVASYRHLIHILPCRESGTVEMILVSAPWDLAERSRGHFYTEAVIYAQNNRIGIRGIIERRIAARRIRRNGNDDPNQYIRIHGGCRCRERPHDARLTPAAIILGKDLPIISGITLQPRELNRIARHRSIDGITDDKWWSHSSVLRDLQPITRHSRCSRLPAKDYRNIARHRCAACRSKHYHSIRC